MADGPEADEPPSIQFPPLITVTDLPGATAAGNLRVCLCVCVSTDVMQCFLCSPANNDEPPLPVSVWVPLL